MKARIVDEVALGAISPLSLRAYAISEGWEAIEPFGNHSYVYALKDSADEIIVPGTTALGDYEAVVAELLARFARAEGRDELQVYRDLSSADRDVVRIRIPEADDDGSVAVNAGVDLFSNSRDLILSAACAAWSPRRSYRAGKVKQADEYMQRLRLGQTEQGSFVVALLSPVPPAIQPQTELWPVESEEPFERLVTRRLAGGLDAAAHAIEQYNLSGGLTAFEDAVAKGVSSNLCDAAAKLSDRGNGVEVSVSWARTRQAPTPRWTRNFSRAEGEVLREVSRLFRDEQARPDEQLDAFIVKLAREGSSPAGAVTMKAYIDGKLASVQANLDASDYDLAIEAHKERRAISAIGTLERIGQRWHLAEVSSLAVVVDDIEEAENADT